MGRRCPCSGLHPFRGTVRPDLLEGVWLAASYIDGHYCGEGGLEVVCGHVDLPNGPGLGIAPEEALFGDPVAEF